MQKNILIIGGNGYIGSRIFHDLQNTFSLESVDLCVYGKNLQYSQVEDYRNLSKDYLHKFEVIILLAGHSSVKMCSGYIISSWGNNITNFIDLVNKLNKSQLLIYASSGSIYGSASSSINSEDSSFIFSPVNNYDITKYVLDMHAAQFIKSGYNIIGYRFGTVNGWSPNVREELMINSMTKHANLHRTISINNKNILRPILGIADISKAISASIKNPVPGIYNLASFYASVDGISQVVSKILGVPVSETPDVAGAYNFNMTTDKFKNTFDFNFGETIETIVTELCNNFEQINFSNRNNPLTYK